MQITRRSLVTGVTRTIDLPVTMDQVNRYQHGASIQDAFPNLTDSQREFYMTGITDEEWDEAFSPDDVAEREAVAASSRINIQFIKLDIYGERMFRQAARSNYKVFTDIDGLWHPCYQDECVQMNWEAATFVAQDKE